MTVSKVRCDFCGKEIKEWPVGSHQVCVLCLENLLDWFRESQITMDECELCETTGKEKYDSGDDAGYEGRPTWKYRRCPACILPWEEIK